MGEMLSQWELRQWAQAEHWPVTNRQFRRYREWGLLPEPIDGRWPEEVADRLIRIRELGTRVRSMPRRVIILRRDYDVFPVPAETLHRAMIEVVPTMSAALTKMRKVHAACIAWGRSTASITIGEQIAFVGEWEPPRPDRWIAILQAADLNRFETCAGLMYYLSTLLSASAQNKQSDLMSIPEEERVILLTVRDLAWQEHVREQVAATQEASDAR